MATHFAAAGHSFSHESSVDSDSDDGSSSTPEHTHPGERSNSTGSKSSRPPPKKRNRAALSCTLCRERKVKCDRVIPCQQCVKRGDAEFCHLDPNKRGPAPKGRKRSQQLGQAAELQQQQQTSASMLAPSTKSSASSSSLNDAYPGAHGTGSAQGLPFGVTMSHMLPPYDTVQSQGQGVPSVPIRHDSSSSSLMTSASGADDIDAIKARLAQLEQALSQQQRMPATSSFSGASPSAYLNMAPSESGASVNSFRSSWAHQSPMQTSLGPSPGGGGVAMQSPNTAAPAFSNASETSGKIAYPANMFSPGQSFKVSSPATRTEDHASPGKEKGRGDVDSDTEDAAMVLEGLAMGSHCSTKKDTKTTRALDVIEKHPTKSIQGFVDEDKTEDIMTEGKYRFEKPSEKSKKDCSSVKDCGKPDQALYEYLKANPDAEFGPDGKRLSPAKRVCVLLSKHNSLFELIWGPETLLGWGMGWAFPAAEAAGDMMNVSEIVGCKGALQREAVLRAVIRSLPQRDVAEHLLDIFDKRVKFMAGNCVHIPTFRKEMQAFYDLDTVEKRARVINFVDPGWLSLLLMIFVLALHFHPVERYENVLHLFDGRTIHLWRSAAQSVLVLARYQTSTSIAVLQSILLMNIIMLGLGKDTHHLVNVAITNALEMGLHRLGDKDKQLKAGENPAITVRREIAKRIWHILRLLDYALATPHSGAYRIHPGQYNTPVPGNYNDEDLSKSPLPPPRPADEYSEMSYPLNILKLAEVYRQNLDMLNASDSRKISCSDMAYLDASYRGLLENAPSFFRIGSTIGEGTTVEVERWLFHQGVFHKLLRLHRPQLSSRTSARTSCVLLARSILDMQRRIRSRCSIVDRLFINLAQSFSAAIVLCLDLLQTRPTAAMRQIVRAEICEALEALRHLEQSNMPGGVSHASQENSIRVIEALLSEEEFRWNQPENASEDHKRKRGPDGTENGRRERKSLLSLALRVAKAANSDAPSGDKPSLADISKTGVQDSVQRSDALAEEQRNKDQHSRELFEQIIHGRPSFAEPSSFSQSTFNGGLGQQNAASAIATTNGLDLSFDDLPSSSGYSQSFDLSRFLAECESNNSPENGTSSAASDSGHSSLHGGGPGSSSASSEHQGFNFRDTSRPHRASAGSGDQTLSPANAFNPSPSTRPTGNTPNGDLGGNTGNFLPPSAFERPSTGLDGFWNWVLGQGGVVQQGESQAAANDANSNGRQEQGRAQLQSAVFGANATSAAPMLGPDVTSSQSSFMWNLGQNLAKNTSAQGGAQQTLAAPTQFGQSGGGTFPSGPSGQSLAGRSTSAAASQDAALPYNSFSSTVGTPSAGVGAAWMSTPGLFDFTLEYGNDSASVAAAAASGPPGASA